jgi:hypothetical protein
VLGEHYVNEALKNMNEFTKDLQYLVTEYIWGSIWAREKLQRKMRSLINIALSYIR